MYVILDDGTAAGTVLELSLAAKEVRVKVDDHGMQLYRWASWDTTHRLAHLRFVETQVV